MSVTIIEQNKCTHCSQSIAMEPQQCVHCLSSFCRQCLIQHHHYAVKEEFLDMVKQIDNILRRFLHHAHSQTEWTNHLTDDRERLLNYVKYIENYYQDLPIVALPSSEWINHVKSLIYNRFFAVHETCSKILYSYAKSFIKAA